MMDKAIGVGLIDLLDYVSYHFKCHRLTELKDYIRASYS